MSREWQFEDEFEDFHGQGSPPPPEDRELIEDYVQIPESGMSTRPRQVEHYIEIGNEGRVDRRTRIHTTIHCCGHQNRGNNAGGVCAVSSRLMCDRCNDTRCALCRRLACPAHTRLHPELGVVACDNCFRPVKRCDDFLVFLSAVAVILFLMILFLR